MERGVREELGAFAEIESGPGRRLEIRIEVLGVNERIHQNGENVSVDLFVRLDGLTKARRGRFIAIALAANGRIGGNARLPNVIKRAREKGVTVLDLSTEMLKVPPDQFQNLFLPGGHHSPAMNRSIAETSRHSCTK